MTPEEMARQEIDRFLRNAGWDVVDRNDYLPRTTSAVREALMLGNKESDYLLFIDDKAIAVLEAKRADNPLSDDVATQAENYAHTPQNWYGLWEQDLIPLVYMSNGKKILFRNLLEPDSDYVELNSMHSPKEMLRLIGRKSDFGALPRLEKQGLRDCQYEAEYEFEKSIRMGQKKNLAVLATGSGKTYLACLASYRLLNYTCTKRILFLVDRNNLARQTENEFGEFTLTEKQEKLNHLYDVKRLHTEDDIKADVVISTIQKLFALMTGQALSAESEDAEDEKQNEWDDNDSGDPVKLSGNISLPPDYFQMIIVDECHRSIYGKWQEVLKYFSGAIILGLTATPTPEAYAFFNNNIIEEYTYEKSVIDGVNVPARVYRIATEVTEHGGAIQSGTKYTEVVRRTGKSDTYVADDRKDYQRETLDRSVTNRQQIRRVLTAYKNAIYNDLYPERTADWASIPKTLIFAKNENHATEIVDAVKDVFKGEFENEEVPEHFVQRITYSSGNSNELIRDLRTEKDFRIAVTVTLVATGTDVKPLEVVLFMKDVRSDVLYTQMKGRGCRVISDDKLREVTPNADSKDCYFIVDAIGVTEHDKQIPKPGPGSERKMTLEQLLERLAHNELSDENLSMLRDCCARIHGRYEHNRLFGEHLERFINEYGFSPRDIAAGIQEAFDSQKLPPYISPSEDNSIRMAVISRLITNRAARNHLLELKKGYTLITEEDPDTLISAGFSKETAQTYISNFETYIRDHKDSIEALRILYNSEDTLITHAMLIDLRDKLLAFDSHFSCQKLWNSYHTLNPGTVDKPDSADTLKALTNLIQLVRYAYQKSTRLTSLITGYKQRWSLYQGQTQRNLTEEQIQVMQEIAEFVVSEGAVTAAELNEINTDLWRRGIRMFAKASRLDEEIAAVSQILLKAA